VQYKEHWNDFCESIQYVDRTGSSELTRWVIKFPFPFSNREYVYRNWIRIEPSPSGSPKIGPTYLISGGVFPQDDHRVARSSSLVRVETSRVKAAARPAGDKACDFVLESLDDPQMTIPKWLFNWFVKTGIPKVRTSLDKAVSGYAAYMATYECDFDESKYVVKVADTKQKGAESSATKEAAAESASTSKTSAITTTDASKDS